MDKKEVIEIFTKREGSIWRAELDEISEIKINEQIIFKKEVDLNKCDIKGCNNDWVCRINFIDMCEFHRSLFKQNEKK